MDDKFEHLKISLEVIQKVTNNFCSENELGKGGFGRVYIGDFQSEGGTQAAVKRLDSRFGQGAVEFWKEIMLLSKYKHENLISLVGFCDESNEKILVYEYAPNKSLDYHLADETLTWIQRLKICLGAARGLEYLHNPRGGQQRVLHRDIKSANILLDENWNAKIADFGLSKLGPANQEYTFMVSNPAGTMGYIDPVYSKTLVLTKESDVYSFGVVLFEVLCSRLCYVQPVLMPLVSIRQKKIEDLINVSLRDQINPDCLDTFTAIAYRCMEDDRKERPSMASIVTNLETALKYQEGRSVAAPKKKKGEGSNVEPASFSELSDDDYVLRGRLYSVRYLYEESNEGPAVPEPVPSRAVYTTCGGLT